ncbi:MAG: histidine kinase [Chitinophagaceae bacterium]|nr:MAG: histidine kinase [Chitinophagaceae bacterium]
MKPASPTLLHSRLYTTLAHIAGWLLFFSLIIGFAVTGPSQLDVSGLVDSMAFLYFAGFFLFLFYLNSYVLFPLLYLRKKMLAYAGCILVLFVVLVMIKPFESFLNIGKTPPTGSLSGPPRGPGSLAPGPDSMWQQRGPGRPVEGMRPQVQRQGMFPRFDIVSIILFIMVWSFSTVLQVLHQWRNTERRAVQAEADRAKTELSFLRAQINPHFLFNTLNNIYSLVITQDAHAPQAVMQLSQIMRYVTDEATRDFVPLEQEVECIRNYINLQRLRLNENTEVLFEASGNMDGYLVPPILLMTFIENIFKYGISSHARTTIVIRVETGDNRIIFHCSNVVFESTERRGREGVGIKNAVSRLQQLYPGGHTLVYGVKDERFIVNLVLTSN